MVNLWSKLKKCGNRIVQNENDPKSADSVQTWWSIVVFLGGLIIFLLIYLNFITLPTGLKISDEADHPNEFIAERAFNHLVKLTAYGPRVAGSYVNEVITVRILQVAIRAVMNDPKRNPKFSIEMDLQVAGSSFNFEDGYGSTVVYKDLQNVVVKVSRNDLDVEPKHSIMMNAHFDSVPTSPGAGDDGSMTVVLLELLRVITQSNFMFKHAFIFLFNGSEENNLQGAHGFIATHKWAESVKAFINMDCAANGGREIMFQAGPKHPWLMDYYRKSAPHPYGTAMAEELFQADMIPSDTDYRQFRDFGGIPGFDLAYNLNGYLYHTKYDAIDTIPLGSLQHTGDNVLELLKVLGNAEEVNNIKEHEEGKVVYFDYLNWFMVYYTETVGLIINLVFSIVAICSILTYVILLGKNREIPMLKIAGEFGLTFTAQFLSLLIGIGLVFLLSMFYDAIGRSMSWLTSSWLVFGLYMCPFYACLTLGPILYLKFAKSKRSDIDNSLTVYDRTELFLHSHCLIFSIMLIVLSALSIRSGYIIMVSVFFYGIFNVISLIVRNIPQWKESKFVQTKLWLTFHFIGILLPYLFYCSLTFTIYGSFLAMTARNGASSNPETLISIFSVLIALLLGGFILPCSLLLRNRVMVPVGLFLITIVFFILMLTPIGFPYRAKTNPQRYWIQHTQKRYHNDAKVYNGYFLHPLDRHANDYLDEFLDVDKLETHDCDSRIYCGLPYYHNGAYGGNKNSRWYPAPAPVFERSVILTQTNRVIDTSTNTTSYSYTLKGPDHMSLYIVPTLGRHLIEWSYEAKIPASGPLYKDRSVYFVEYFYGRDRLSDGTFEFEIKIKNDQSHKEIPNNLELAVAGQYMHDNAKITNYFSTFLDGLPEWSVCSYWVSYYESFLVE